MGLAIDQFNKPVVAWYETQTKGEGRQFQVWRPGGKINAAIEKKDADSPDIAIAVGGDNIGPSVRNAAR